MQIRAAVAAVGIAAGLSGCATAPSEQDLKTADYGQPVSQAVAEVFAEAFLKRTLKDPESARIEWGTLAPSWVKPGWMQPSETMYGYLLPASVNAKNSYGGYTGARQYQFMFRNGELVAAWGEQAISSRKTAMIRIK
jgi:hypothetical protein